MQNSPSYVEKDFKFQTHEWVAIKIGWYLMLAIIIAGLLGLFGSGPLSSKTAKIEGASVVYERYLRYSMESEISITVTGQLPDSSIYINAGYLEKVKIIAIRPGPESMETMGDNERFKFHSGDPKKAVLHLEPTETGPLPLGVGLKGKIEKLNQYVYF